MNPQFYDNLIGRLLAAGARDAWLVPVQMKKGRPGVIVSALAEASRTETLTDLLLRETTTLGVRCHAVQRQEAERSFETVTVRGGSVRIKVKRWHGEVLGGQPEYGDCQRLAEQLGLPVKIVWEEAFRRWGGPGLEPGTPG